MCGLAGFIGEGNTDQLKAMISAIAHRGPDDSGTWRAPSKPVYLGHRRLSIIDLASGHQPMADRRGELTLVFNGEIYNHLELRSQLISLGHQFETDHSDTEVLLHGYRQWGRDLPNHLNGMWALAIWDERQQKMFLSRDRFGKKPLFYHYRPGFFGFASELTALIKHNEVSANLSEIALKKYYAYGFIPAPYSIYDQVFKLPAGCNLEWTEDRITVDRYWRYVAEPFDHRPQNAEALWAEELLEHLKTAVQRRMMSDVPLGVFLSGGIDSSAVTAIASKLTPGLKTFSIGFEEAGFDESAKARLVSEQFGTDHYTRMVSLDGAAGALPSLIAKLDEPMGDSSLLPTFLLSEMTRQHVTVALGGDGADELFAGYDPFKALGMATFYDAVVPGKLHSAIRFLANHLPTFHGYMSLDFKIKRTLRGLSQSRPLWNPVWLGPLEPRELSELFESQSDPEEIYSEAIESWNQCEQDNLIDKTSAFYINLYLSDDILVKVDRASMLNSLEARSPFLDRDLVDFARKIPAEFKLRNGTTKYILKKALEPILPHEILYQRKQGFALPVGPWFKSKKLGFEATNPFEAHQLASHRSGEQDNRLYLWNTWVLKQKGIEVQRS